MHSAAATTDLSQEKLTQWGQLPMQKCAGIGAAGLGVALVLGITAPNGLKALSFAYVTCFAFFLSISLGAILFVMIQHITRAGWSVVIRRIAENLAYGVFPLALLFLPILVPVMMGLSPLYEWNHAEVVAEHPLLQKKEAYLNAGFFTVRWIFYFAMWTFSAWKLREWSLKQDADGDPKWSGKLEQFSCGMAFVMAFTLTFAAFDLLMSLDAEWFSTIFGPYYFAGSMVSFFATISLLVIWLQKQGLLKGPITVEHRHDLGKLLFGFNCFWAYLAMSQYLLIWYSNIPEETRWYQVRQNNGWEYVSIVLIVCHFVIPFLGFMSRHVKRSTPGLVFWSIWLLVIHFIDLYWLAMPVYSPQGPTFGLTFVAAFIGCAGIFAAGVLWATGTTTLIPYRDPRLTESLQFQNI